MKLMGKLPGLAFLTTSLFAGADCSHVDGIERGKCYEAAQNWSSAEEAYRLAMQRTSDSGDAVVAHARTLVRLHQPFDALIELEDLLKRKPDEIPAAKLYAALCDSVLGDHAKAQDTLAAVVRLAPKDAEAWEALGTHQLDRGKPEDAVLSFQRALTLNAADPLILASLAYGLSQLGDEDQARALFHQALQLPRNPMSAAVDLLYGDFLLAHGRASESLPILTRAIVSDPQSGDAYYRRALANEKAGLLNRALEDARAALRISGERVDAHLLLQRVSRKTGNDEQARSESEKIEALQSAKEHEQALGRTLRENLNRGEPLLDQHKFAEAIPYYEAILRVLPGFYEAWFALGVSYAQTGKGARAEEALRNYLRYQPLSADGHASYGLLLISLQRNEEAVKELKEALALDPAMDEVRSQLNRLQAGSAR